MPHDHLQLKAASREIVRGKQTSTFVAFAQPLEHKNGYVFLLLDLDNSCKAASRIISMLRESAERLGRTLSDRSHLQHRFEQVLQAVNEDLSDIVDEFDVSPQNLHMALGVLRESSFIFSATGHLNALFLRKTTKQRFKVFDLSQSIHTEAGKVDSDKIFSVVLDGDLQAEDVLLIASRDLSTYLDIEDIHPLLSTLPPASALETIEQYMPAKSQLSLLLFQAKPEKDVVTGFAKTVSSAASMDALMGTEQDTAHMLELEKPHVQQTFTRLVSLVKSGNTIERKEALRRALDKLWKLAKILGVQLFHIINSVFVSIASLIVALIRRDSRRERALKNMKSTWARTFKVGTKKFSKAPMTGKMLLIGGGSIIVVLVALIVVFQVKGNIQADNQAFAATLEQVEEKRSAANARFIYKDEATALSLLQEAMSILDAIETKKDARLETIAEARAQVEADLDSVRHILTPQITRAAFVNKVATSAAGEILFFNDGSVGKLVGENIEALELTGESIGEVSSATTHNNLVMLVDNTSTLFELNTETGEITRTGINTVEGEFGDVHDTLHYGERLYVLTSSQLYRHQRLENGEYGPGTAWITDPVSLDNSSAVSIDGSVWIAYADGTLRKLEKGIEVGADISAIDPALTNIVDMWTTADTTLLYALDVGGNRVVVYNKETHELVGQYVDEQFAQGMSISVDTSARSATVITPTGALTFPLTSVLQ